MESPVYRFGEFRLDPVKRELWRGDALVEAPARAFACLRYLIEHRERAIGRSELIEALWHRSNVSDTQLFQLILRTRRLVGDEAERQQAIRTVAGFGYRWVAPTEVDCEPAARHAPAPEPAPSLAPPADEPAAAPATASPRPRRRLAVMAAAVLIAGLAAMGGWMLHGAAPTAAQRPVAPPYADARVAVLPFHVEAGADAAWVRFGGMDLVADRLRRAGVAVQPSEATLGLVMAASGEADGGAARLRSGSGVELLVDGRVDRAGSAWQVALRADAPDLPPLQSTASDGDLMAALRAASDRLLLALGRAPPTGALDAALAEVLQRARAALLADDAGQARSVLEQAPTALREDPELRLLLAQIEARQGRFDAAEALLTALIERLDGNDDAYLRMRALIARGSARLPLNRLVEAGADFDAAIAVPGAETFVHALGDAYHGRGASRTHRLEYAAAADDLGRARVLLGQSGDALAVARVDLALALLDSMRGAFAQAGPRYAQAARQFESFGALRPLKSALIGLQDVQFDQLQNHAALASSDRAWALGSAKGDPLLQRVLSLMRARILLACGRLRELHELLARIDAGDRAYLAESRDEERLRVLRTELALREGRDADAAREAAALPTAWLPGDADDTLRAKAALWRQRARPPTAAAPGVAIAPSTQDDAGSRSGAPYRRLAQAERAVRLGQSGEADGAYRQAVALADADGVPFALSEVIRSYAGFLLAQGRLADAAALGGRIGAWAADDFDCAVLQLRIAHALGDPSAWQAALANARRLAGERPIAPELLLAPASGSSAKPLKEMAQSRAKQSGSGS